MKALLLLVAVAIMSSGVRGGSQSMSCSTVNGKMICNKESSAGNVAMSSSQAGTGGGGDYQSTFAGTGFSGTDSFSSSGQQVGQPPAYGQPQPFNPFSFVGAAAPGAFGGAFAGAGAGVFPFGRR